MAKLDDDTAVLIASGEQNRRKSSVESNKKSPFQKSGNLLWGIANKTVEYREFQFVYICSPQGKKTEAKIDSYCKDRIF